MKEIHISIESKMGFGRGLTHITQNTNKIFT